MVTFTKNWISILLYFLLLFILPYPLNQLPMAYMGWWSEFTGWWNQMIVWLVQNVGAPIFGMVVNVNRPYRSGDTTFSWVQNGFFLIMAIVGTCSGLFWIGTGKSYARLWKWFYILMVYNLAYWMFVYGLIKVFSGQFSGPEYPDFLKPTVKVLLCELCGLSWEAQKAIRLSRVGVKTLPASCCFLDVLVR